MEKLYVVAIKPVAHDLGVLFEMNEFIREQAGGCEFLVSPHWHRPPPFTDPPTLPVLCTERVMRPLLLRELEDASPNRVMHCYRAEWEEGDVRHWRRVARQKNPLPDGKGVFPWERVGFRINEAEHDLAVLLEAFTSDPYEVKGDILLASPDDAMILLALHPPGSFTFIGTADGEP